MNKIYRELSEEAKQDLKCIAETLVTSGKGIVTADESATTINKRFLDCGIRVDENNRKQWRQLLFSTDPKIKDYISGVVVSDDTLYQKDESGKFLIDYLKDRCILVGIKVDTGLATLPFSEDEVITQGLDCLAERLIDYKKCGCEFARWRCVFRIGKNTPSYRAIQSNVEILARFACTCQCLQICPLVEPEVCPEGNHDIHQCQSVTETVLSFLFRSLNDHHVFLEGIVLKVNMVTPGMSYSHSSPNEIAKATITALRRTVPPAVAGICFSSDGQTEEEAPINLQAINAEKGSKPWSLTFAYGRPIQASALRVWNGNPKNLEPAQEEFLKHAAENAYACREELRQCQKLLQQNDDVMPELQSRSVRRHEYQRMPPTQPTLQSKPEGTRYEQKSKHGNENSRTESRAHVLPVERGVVENGSYAQSQLTEPSGPSSPIVGSRSTASGIQFHGRAKTFELQPPDPRMDVQPYPLVTNSREPQLQIDPLAAPPMLDPRAAPPLLNPEIKRQPRFDSNTRPQPINLFSSPSELEQEHPEIDPNEVRNIPNDCRLPYIPRIIAPKVTREPDVNRL